MPSENLYSLIIIDEHSATPKYLQVINSIVKAIEDSPLREKKEYVYSDLSYYLYPPIIQRLTGKDWDTYLKETFYKPLGANTLTYNPLRFFPLSQIVPTEYDSLFRKNLIQGHVHDRHRSRPPPASDS